MKKLLAIIVLGLLWNSSGFTQDSLQESFKKNNEEENVYNISYRCSGLYLFLVKKDYDERLIKLNLKTKEEQNKFDNEFFENNQNKVYASMFMMVSVGLDKKKNLYSIEDSAKLVVPQTTKWKSIYTNEAKKNFNNSGNYFSGGFIKKDFLFCEKAKDLIISDSEFKIEKYLKIK